MLNIESKKEKTRWKIHLKKFWKPSNHGVHLEKLAFSKTSKVHSLPPFSNLSVLFPFTIKKHTKQLMLFFLSSLIFQPLFSLHHFTSFIQETPTSHGVNKSGASLKNVARNPSTKWITNGSKTSIAYWTKNDSSHHFHIQKKVKARTSSIIITIFIFRVSIFALSCLLQEIWNFGTKDKIL